MKLKKLGLTLLSLMIASTSFGADIDLKNSVFQWTGSKITGSKHTGKIFLTSANAVVKNKKLQTGNFVMKVGSFTVEDLKGEWASKFLSHLKGPDFFEIETHPTAKLSIDSYDGKMAKAKLTIKGKTQPVSFKMKQAGNKYSGKLVFNRTKYNMVYGSGSFFKGLGDKTINDDVTVDFSFIVK